MVHCSLTHCSVICFHRHMCLRPRLLLQSHLFCVCVFISTVYRYVFKRLCVSVWHEVYTQFTLDITKHLLSLTLFCESYSVVLFADRLTCACSLITDSTADSDFPLYLHPLCLQGFDMTLLLEVLLSQQDAYCRVCLLIPRFLKCS